jgi:preprotein translocase subunit SecA
VADSVERLVNEYLVGDYVEEWDFEGLFTQLEQIYPVAMTTEDVDMGTVDKDSLIAELREDVVKAYEEREEELGEELMRALERYILLQIIDERWREHLHDMDYLREGIHLRGFAQIDPLVAYKNEGFEMFGALMNSIWEEFGRYIFRVEVQIEGENGQGAQQGGGPQQPNPWATGANTSSTRNFSYTGGTAEDQPSALAAAAAAGGAAAAGMEFAEDDPTELLPHVETRHVDEKEQIGRNDPCWCGSGKKFKKCHGAA